MAVPPVLVTVTVVAVGSGELFSEAVTVTVVAVALSPTAAGFSDRVTAVGAVSSSVMVSVAVPAVNPVAVPVRMTVSSAFVQAVSGWVEGQRRRPAGLFHPGSLSREISHDCWVVGPRGGRAPGPAHGDRCRGRQR